MIKMEKVYEKQTECPECKSKNLSNGTNDFLYDAEKGIEVPIQFCNDCHSEWFVKQTVEVQER